MRSPLLTAILLLAPCAPLTAQNGDTAVANATKPAPTADQLRAKWDKFAAKLPEGTLKRLKSTPADQLTEDDRALLKKIKAFRAKIAETEKAEVARAEAKTKAVIKELFMKLPEEVRADWKAGNLDVAALPDDQRAVIKKIKKLKTAHKANDKTKAKAKAKKDGKRKSDRGAKTLR